MSALFPLTVRAAKTARRGTVLVGPVDLEMSGEGTTVVVGPNGSGKTSLLTLLHGTNRLTAGEITWSLPMEDARAAQAFVFQRPVMLRRSVIDNIAYPLHVQGVSRKQARAQARDWANRVGLGAFLARPARSLSGGEQQKLALARAMIGAPKVLFLDEPCAALDGRATREIEAILTEIRAAGTKLILSTHDLGQARRLADDIIFLLHGKVHEQGTAKGFFAGPQTPEAQAFLRGDIVE
ncbi:MAG: ATP-binding cassette domain-containing protein [Pseudomonadota bacterium]